MSNFSEVVYPLEGRTKDLVAFANLIQHNTPELRHNTMIEVMFLIYNWTDSRINETYDHVLPSDENPRRIIEELNYALPQLPTNVWATSMNVFYSVLIAITTIFVALRFAARKFVTPKEIRREDWACFNGYVWCFLLTGGLLAQNTLTHAGHHNWVLTLEQLRRQQIIVVTNQYFFFLAHFFVKFAFLVFYHRLSPSRLQRTLVWFVFVYILATLISGIFISIFQCNPVNYWDHFDTMKCINQLKWFEAHGICFVIADFLILFVPIPAVLKLNLKLKDKLLLIGMFSMGGFISIVSIIRIFALRDWLATPDPSYRMQIHDRWVMLELDIAIWVMCAPAIKVLFHHTDVGKSPILSFSGLMAGRKRRVNMYGETDLLETGSGTTKGTPESSEKE